MRYISYAVDTGQKNMDIDAQLLEDAITKNLQEPIFRLYGWAPACVSLGRNQDDKFLDYDFLKSKNIDVVAERFYMITKLCIVLFVLYHSLKMGKISYHLI